MPPQNNKQPQDSKVQPDFIPYNPAQTASSDADFIPYNPPDTRTQFERDRPGGQQPWYSGWGNRAWQGVKDLVQPSPVTWDENKSFWGNIGANLDPRKQFTFDPEHSGIAEAGREAAAGYKAGGDIPGQTVFAPALRGTAAGKYISKVGEAAASGLGSLFAGVSEREALEHANRGETGQILGQITVPTATAALPIAQELAGRALSPLRVRSGTKLVGKGLNIPPSTEAAELAGKGMPEAVNLSQDLQIARPHLAEIERQGNPGLLAKLSGQESSVTGKGSARTFSYAKNIYDYADNYWQQTHNEPIARQAGRPVNTQGIVDSGVQSMSGSSFTNDAVQAATDKVWKEFQPPRTVAEADNLIRELNADLKTPRAQTSYGPIDMRVRNGIVKYLRNEVDRGLQAGGEAGVGGPTGTNKTWGAISNMADQAVKQGIKEAKAEGKAGVIPDWIHAYVFAHGDSLTGGLGLRPQDALKPTPSGQLSKGMGKLGRSRIQPPPLPVGGTPYSPPPPAAPTTPTGPTGGGPTPAGPQTPPPTVPQGPTGPVGGLPRLGFPAQTPNLWSPRGPFNPTWQSPGTSVPAGGVSGLQPTAVELPDTITSPSGGPAHPQAAQGGASVPTPSTPPPTDLSVAPRSQPEVSVLPEQVSPDFVDQSVHPWESDARVNKATQEIAQGSKQPVIVARPNPDGTVSPVKGHQTPKAAGRLGQQVQIVNSGPITDGEKAAMTAESHFFPQDDRAVPASLAKDAQNERDMLPEEVHAEPALPAKEGDSSNPIPSVERRGALPGGYAGTERRSVYQMSAMSQPTPGEQLAQSIRAAGNKPAMFSEGEVRAEIAKDPQLYSRFRQAEQSNPKLRDQMIVDMKNRMESSQAVLPASLR